MPRKKYQTMALVFFVLLLAFIWMLTATPAHAIINEIVNGVIRVLSYVMLSVAHIAIGFTLFFLRFFINLASYNGYIDAPIVVVGWTMVRDVANMFFVVIMLVIAFATILGLEQYEWRKLLVKLLLMAIFINFSNMIAQLVIDIAHVFTITFLNAISAAAGGNLINMFKLEKIVSIVGGTPDFSSAENFGVNILVASMAATIFAILAATTMGAYAIAMAIRVVVLWTLIILSPLAFVFAVLPATQDKAKEWWNEFSKHVIAAPFMVFFLWLAFATLGQGDAIQQIEQGASEQLSIASAEPPKLSLSEVTSWENMASFFVAMAFLWIGIEKVQELGIRGGSIIGSSLNFAKKVATIATGYAAGRWLVGKGQEIGKKAGKGALWYAPLVGGEKWAMHGKIFGRAVQGWYRGKGYATTQRGEELRGEAEDLMKQHAAEKDPEEKKKLMEQVKEKEALMSKEFRKAGGIVGWASRSGIQLEKQLSKTEKQAANRREVLWKRIGSEAGGKVLWGMIQIGMGTKGLFGTGFMGDQYAGQDAQDRIERGWLKGEELRSRGKDHEFEAKGKEEVLEKARMKYDVNKGRMTYEVNAGTMMERVEGHETRGETYDQSDHKLQAEARLKLILENGPTWQNFLKAQNVANLTKLRQTSTEQRFFKEEDARERTEGVEANERAIKLEQQAMEAHSVEADKELKKIPELAKQVKNENATDEERESARKRIATALLNAKAADESDVSVKAKKKALVEKASDERNKSIAWRYAAAKASEEEQGKLFTTTNQQLLADAEQFTVYGARGASIPRSAMGELTEQFKKGFNDMPFEVAVANEGTMSTRMVERRRDPTLSKADQRIDRAISMGLFMRTHDQSWIDDNVYGLRDSPEMTQLLQDDLGWNPNQDVMTLDNLGDINAMYATAFDMEYVKVDSFVRNLLKQCEKKGDKLGEEKIEMGLEQAIEGLKTGVFKDKSGADVAGKLRTRLDASDSVEQSVKQKQLLATVFGGGATAGDRTNMYSQFKEKLRTYQPEFEVLGNLRDKAISSTHGENAGFYQNAEIDGERLYLPVSGRMAEDYVLGDVRKVGDPRKLYGHQFHAWADVVQGAFGGPATGQGLLRIRPEAYASYRGNIEDYKSWAVTPQRTKKVLRGLLANESESDYKDNDGYFVLGDLRNQKGKAWGLLEDLKYLDEGGEYKGKPPEEQRKAALKHLFNENFVHQLRYGGRDLLYSLATAAGVPIGEAELSGKIKLKVKDAQGRMKTFEDINTLVDSINDGSLLGTAALTGTARLSPLQFADRRGGGGNRPAPGGGGPAPLSQEDLDRIQEEQQTND